MTEHQSSASSSSSEENSPATTESALIDAKAKQNGLMDRKKTVQNGSVTSLVTNGTSPPVAVVPIQHSNDISNISVPELPRVSYNVVMPEAFSTQSYASQGGEKKKDTVDANSKRYITTAILITIGVCFTNVGSVQFTKSALTSADKAFNAPTLLVYFNTCWICLVYPIYFIGAAILRRIQSHNDELASEKSIRHIWSESAKVFGMHGIQLKLLASRVLPFAFLWIAANTTYSYALTYISVAETTALFSSNIAFIYLLSWIFLQDKFVALRVFGVLLSITGILLTAHGEGIRIMEGNYKFVGVILAVAASGLSAIYKVMFKRLVGNATLGEVSLVLSCIGLTNLLLFWPLPLTFAFVEPQNIEWSNIPYGFVCGSALLALCYNFLINIGVAFTHPLLVSVGVFIATPINAVVDLTRNERMENLQIVGAVCILTSFVLLLLPESFCDVCMRSVGLRGFTDERPQKRRGLGHSRRKSKITDSTA